MNYNDGNPYFIKDLPKELEANTKDVKKSDVCIDIPIDMHGNRKKINLLSLRSWWKDPISEKYFYLHPEFVSKYENKEKGQECYGFVTCDKCRRCFENGKIPEECVAKADFGDYNRLGLEKLTSKEKLVLALHRPYIHIDKIRFTKRPNDERQYALKSNSFSFPHKSGSIVVESLTKSVKNAEAIMSSAVIQFVGS